eukprot:15451757-Alexandrium_andersonii.AAC.1
MRLKTEPNLEIVGGHETNPVSGGASCGAANDRVPAFTSPLYKGAVARQDLTKGVGVTLGGAGTAEVVVADGDRNELMRSVRRSAKDGLHYYKSPRVGKWAGGTNVSHALEQVQEYARSTQFPSTCTAVLPGGGQEPNLAAVRYESVRDFAATLKAASNSPAHAFWWPDAGVQLAELVGGVLLHYAAPFQVFSLETGKPEPE